MILGAFAAMVLLGIGLFWLQGRAAVEKGAPPPDPPSRSSSAGAGAAPDDLPTAYAKGQRGQKPPDADQFSKDQERFFRLDKNRDGKVTRNELLSTRSAAFRKLDKDGNNLLTFEEWAVSTSDRFGEMDTNKDGIVSPAEVSAYYAKQDAKRARTKPSCACD